MDSEKLQRKGRIRTNRQNDKKWSERDDFKENGKYGGEQFGDPSDVCRGKQPLNHLWGGECP